MFKKLKLKKEKRKNKNKQTKKPPRIAKAQYRGKSL